MPPINTPADDLVNEMDIENPFAGGDPIEDEDDQYILDQPEPRNLDDDDDDEVSLADADKGTEEETDEEKTDEEETDEEKTDEEETDEEETDEEETDEEETDEEETDEEETDEEETDDDKEEESEEESDDDKDKEPETDNKPSTVPFKRLDKEIQRRQTLQKKLDEAEKALAEKETSLGELDLGETVTGMFDEVLEGNLDKANDAMKEILTKVAQVTRDSVLADIDTRIDTRTARHDVSRTIDEVVTDLESTYPELNQASEQFDQALTRRALNLQRVYIDEGNDAATALELGVQDAITMLRPDLAKVGQAVDEPVKQNLQAKKKAQQKKAAVKKNAQAAQKQAPKLQGRRESVDAKSISEMTEEEFEQLSREELARARGDIL